MKEGMWAMDKADFVPALLENFGAMVARTWTDEEKAKLASVTMQIVNEMQDKFCITDGERLGCMNEAWVAVSTK